MEALARVPTGPEVESGVREIFQAHGKAVYGIARRITGRPEDAEDVLQSVFLRMIQREHQAGVGRPGNLQAYLKRSAVNAALDLLRRRKRQRTVSLSDEGAADAVPVAAAGGTMERVQTIEIGRLKDRLRRALLELTPLESEAFTLKYFEGHKGGEIAGILETSPNAVNVALFKARKKLKRILMTDSEVMS